MDGLAPGVKYPGSTPWAQLVSEGRVPGYSFMHKFGANGDIDTGSDPEDCWSYGGLYTFSETADITQVSSGSAADLSPVLILGLDANGLEVTQVVTLTGTIPVILPIPLLRFFRAQNLGTVNFVGDIYISTDGAALSAGIPTDPTTVRGTIESDRDRNQTLLAVYTIPANKVGYYYGVYASLNKSSGNYADLTIRARPQGGVFLVQGEISLVGTGTNYMQFDQAFPPEIAPMTDLLIRIDEVEANNCQVSSGFTILLKDI